MRTHYEDATVRILKGDVLSALLSLPDGSVDTVITSPPYFGLRDYGYGGHNDMLKAWKKYRSRFQGAECEFSAHLGDEVAPFAWFVKYGGQLGLEPRWQWYVWHLVEIFREVWRVLKDEGSLWLVMGDTYAGSGCGWSKHGGTVGIHSIDARDPSMWPKGRPPQFISSSKDPVMRPKQRMLIPDRLAMALQEDGWLLRNDCIWHKPNSMPASVKDRLSNTFEHIFHFVKKERYYYNLDAIREPHKTQSLERYQRGLNQKAGLSRAYQGKHKGREEQTSKEGGTLGSSVREGISCHPPQWFQEMFPPDASYKGKFDDLVELQVERPGSRANNLNLKVAHQNRNFMPYKPRHFELLSEEDKARVLEALEAGLRVDIVTKATAASIRAHDSGRAKEIAEKGYAVYINHPNGRNPGDVMGRHHGSGPQFRLSGLRRGQKYVDNPQPGAHSHIRRGGELTHVPEDNLHPLGRNPGDVARLAEELGLPLDAESLFYDYLMRLLAEKERAEQEGWEPDFWSVNTQPYPEAHFAVFPEEICRKPILATCPPRGTVLDPFCGSGTALAVARRLGRKAIGIDIVKRYCELAARRCQQQVMPLESSEGGDKS